MIHRSHPIDRRLRQRPSPTQLLPLCAALVLTGCQSLSSASAPPQVRIVDASPDAPTLDVYHRTGALTYNLTFANVTSYIAAPSGASELSVDLSGSQQTLTALRDTLTPSTRYTLLIGGTANILQSTLLKDQSTPAPAGQVALRFLDQIDAGGPVDIFLVPTGSSATSTEPLLLGQSFAANSGYLTIPAGAYRIVLYATGTTPSTGSRPAYSGPTVTYPSGAVRTIILLDRPGTVEPTLQSIMAEDFDPLLSAN